MATSASPQPILRTSTPAPPPATATFTPAPPPPADIATPSPFRPSANRDVMSGGYMVEEDHNIVDALMNLNGAADQDSEIFDSVMLQVGPPAVIMPATLPAANWPTQGSIPTAAPSGFMPFSATIPHPNHLNTDGSHQSSPIPQSTPTSSTIVFQDASQFHAREAQLEQKLEHVQQQYRLQSIEVGALRSEVESLMKGSLQKDEKISWLEVELYNANSSSVEAQLKGEKLLSAQREIEQLKKQLVDTERNAANHLAEVKGMWKKEADDLREALATFKAVDHDRIQKLWEGALNQVNTHEVEIRRLGQQIADKDAELDRGVYGSARPVLILAVEKVPKAEIAMSTSVFAEAGGYLGGERHPNLVMQFGLSEAGFPIMEYVHGVTADQYHNLLTMNPVTFNKSLSEPHQVAKRRQVKIWSNDMGASFVRKIGAEVILGLFQGLAKLHSRRLVHGDLHDDNLFAELGVMPQTPSNGIPYGRAIYMKRLKIGDFGTMLPLDRVQRETTKLPNNDQVPPHIPPECVEGSTAERGLAIDIYSVCSVVKRWMRLGM
ncbi:hypothetical protein HDU93_006446 [Gonapodya sp. JEL0774]|nr:hypothetical protein HDU93_006446 [Gonapodya sp. JEL0774]